MEAPADPACGGHRRNWLKPGLGEQHGYPLATYSESHRTVRPSAARIKVRAVRLLIASKGWVIGLGVNPNPSYTGTSYGHASGVRLFLGAFTADGRYHLKNTVNLIPVFLNTPIIYNTLIRGRWFGWGPLVCGEKSRYSKCTCKGPPALTMATGRSSVPGSLVGGGVGSHLLNM